MSDFSFDLDAKRIRISNNEILQSLQRYAEIVNFQYFSTIQYNKWKDKICHTTTISDRFGSWNKALKIIGIEGGRERNYTPNKLIENLENIWKNLGYPPGRGQIAKYGQKISERPYKRIWGSVSIACKMLAEFHKGKLTFEELLNGYSEKNTRDTIPLNIRWKVLKRNNYTCVKCGQSPAKNDNIELEIDHIFPFAKGGSNDIENLQTLCRNCNQGKKDKI